MDLICKLLEEAITQYRQGDIALGDKALAVAMRLRKEIDRGYEIIPIGKLKEQLKNP